MWIRYDLSRHKKPRVRKSERACNQACEGSAQQRPKETVQMTLYESLTLLIAVISAIIAVTSLVRTRRLAEEQVRLGKVTEELTRKQIAQIESQEIEKKSPKLSVDLVKVGKDYSFIVANRGQGSAFDLDLELVDCADSPLLGRQLEDNFPHPELRSENRIKLLAAIHMGSPTKYIARLSWKDSEGEKFTEDHQVTL